MYLYMYICINPHAHLHIFGTHNRNEAWTSASQRTRTQKHRYTYKTLTRAFHTNCSYTQQHAGSRPGHLRANTYTHVDIDTHTLIHENVCIYFVRTTTNRNEAWTSASQRIRDRRSVSLVLFRLWNQDLGFRI